MVDSSRHSTSIGPSMLVRGNLEGDEDLTVLGRVEGNVQLTRTLIVENGGIVKADVEVRNAVISGIVVGNIIASDSVEITETGRVVGDISAPRVLIVDGARFRGLVDMGDLDAPRATEPLPARTVSRSGGTASTAIAARPATQPRSAVPTRRPTPPPPPTRPAPAPAPAPAPTRAASSSGTAASKKKKKTKKKVVVRKKKKSR